MASSTFVNSGSDNGLLLDCIKPIPLPGLTTIEFCGFYLPVLLEAPYKSIDDMGLNMYPKLLPHILGLNETIPRPTISMFGGMGDIKLFASINKTGHDWYALLVSAALSQYE